MAPPQEKIFGGRRTSAHLVCVMLVLLGVCGGCQSQEKSKSPWAPAKQTAVISSDQINSELFHFADSFIARVSQACDQVEQKYGADSPKLRRQVQEIKIGQTLAAIDIATGPNPEINVF